MDEALALIQDCIGHRFAQPELLTRALTHPSFAGENAAVSTDNQRLEYLGDAVLQLVVSDVLFRRFPDRAEGGLTKLRSALTKEQALVDYAHHIGLGPGLRLGVGEERTGGRERPSNLADAFEALLGALYLDAGLAPAADLCRELVEMELPQADRILAEENPKGALQEWTQARSGTLPVYEVASACGPVHDPEFEVRVCVSGKEVARAVGNSRRTAERRAAVRALAALREEQADG